MALAACRGDGRSPSPPTPPQADAPGGSPGPAPTGSTNSAGSTGSTGSTGSVPSGGAPAGSDKLVAAPREVAGKLKLSLVTVGLRRPVLVTAAPGDPKRLYLVEQPGSIRVYEDGGMRKERFFDLTGKVSRGNEQGLLGLAFHPKFAENGKLYVNYTDPNDDTHIVEYQVTSDRQKVDMASARELAKVEQPYSNHNGGHLLFGPDGKLYAGLGDGGSAGDPKGNGQNKQALLGKLLRFDVDAAPGSAAAQAERVYWGLRNPWRFTFDAKTGDLFIGDVGQNLYEYVFAVAGGDGRAHNFGWNVVEGNHCYDAATCDKAGFTPPAIEYSHEQGCSITGGVVYRGKALPELDGAYFYADYCTGLIRSFRWTRDASDTAVASGKPTGFVRDHWDWRAALDPKGLVSQISSFGVDGDGELYIVSLTGQLWKLERA